MNRTSESHPLLVEVPATSPDSGLFARWLAEPTYRLANLAGDPESWCSVDVDLLELLVFDQCVVFGAAFPGTLAALDAIAGRDRIVRQSRHTIWMLYAAFAARTRVDRRLRLLRDVSAAVSAGVGSRGSLLPFGACDPARTVASEARRLATTGG